MHSPLKAMYQEIQSQYHDMVDTLYQWCDINSGSLNLAGLKHMLTVLNAAFSSIADSIEIHPSPPIHIVQLNGLKTTQELGNLLFIRKRTQLKRRILISAHMDTVFTETHPFQKVKALDTNTLNGPGVTDMKGGILVILHALRAFEKLPEAAQLGWDIVINADEELGSPSSRIFLDTIAPQYSAGLVYEPAMTNDGVFAKNRRGSGKLTLICTGKAAHAGRDFHAGRNAIIQLAKVLIKIHALNKKRAGITINVGQVAGGEALNIIPEKAVAKLDIRITKPIDEQWVREQIQRIIDDNVLEGYQLELLGSFDRPVKRVSQATEQLFKRIQHIGKELNLNLQWKDSGGCCDGNNLAAHGLAVIDTLGVRGGAIHSANEFILLDSLIERTLLSTLLFSDLAQGGLEKISIKRNSQ